MIKIIILKSLSRIKHKYRLQKIFLYNKITVIKKTHLQIWNLIKINHRKHYNLKNNKTHKLNNLKIKINQRRTLTKKKNN